MLIPLYHNLLRSVIAALVLAKYVPAPVCFAYSTQCCIQSASIIISEFIANLWYTAQDSMRFHFFLNSEVISVSNKPPVSSHFKLGRANFLAWNHLFYLHQRNQMCACLKMKKN